jgi:hypothetical protein
MLSSLPRFDTLQPSGLLWPAGFASIGSVGYSGVGSIGGSVGTGIGDSVGGSVGYSGVGGIGGCVGGGIDGSVGGRVGGGVGVVRMPKPHPPSTFHAGFTSLSHDYGLWQVHDRQMMKQHTNTYGQVKWENLWGKDEETIREQKHRYQRVKRVFAHLDSLGDGAVDGAITVILLLLKIAKNVENSFDGHWLLCFIVDCVENNTICPFANNPFQSILACIIEGHFKLKHYLPFINSLFTWFFGHIATSIVVSCKIFAFVTILFYKVVHYFIVRLQSFEKTSNEQIICYPCTSVKKIESDSCFCPTKKGI